MGWAAVIIGVLQLVLPLIEECTKKRLEKAAKKLPKPSTFATEGAAVEALCDKAAASARLPRVKKAILRLKAVAVENGKLRTRPLTAAEIAEGTAMVAGLPRR